MSEIRKRIKEAALEALLAEKVGNICVKYNLDDDLLSRYMFERGVRFESVDFKLMAIGEGIELPAEEYVKSVMSESYLVKKGNTKIKTFVQKTFKVEEFERIPSHEKTKNLPNEHWVTSHSIKFTAFISGSQIKVAHYHKCFDCNSSAFLEMARDFYGIRLGVDNIHQAVSAFSNPLIESRDMLATVIHKEGCVVGVSLCTNTPVLPKEIVDLCLWADDRFSFNIEGLTTTCVLAQSNEDGKAKVIVKARTGKYIRASLYLGESREVYQGHLEYNWKKQGRSREAQIRWLEANVGLLVEKARFVLAGRGIPYDPRDHKRIRKGRRVQA